jgi:hypothetical protein
MKKLLLGLGTLSLAILPVAAMASCSTSMTNEVLKIKLLSGITTITQDTINKTAGEIAVAQALPSTNPEEIKTKNDKLVSILKNVFIGINTENINNFEVSLTGDADKTIILTSKVIGNIKYIFANETNVLTAVASAVPTKSLPITLAADITQAMIETAISAYQVSETETDMAKALVPLFEGITADSLMGNKLSVELIATTETVPGKILLVASPDYFFTNATDTILVAIPAPTAPVL